MAPNPPDTTHATPMITPWSHEVLDWLELTQPQTFDGFTVEQQFGSNQYGQDLPQNGG